MIKIFQVEYAKLRKYHVLKILFLAYMAIIPCWMYFMDFFFKNNPEIKQIFTGSELFAFPDVWTFTTYCASFFNILLCVIIVIITCNELQHKTMRQNIIDGLNKQQVIAGKFFVVLFMSVVATLYTFLTALTIGGIAHGFSGFYENIHTVFYYFLQTLGYFSFAFLFALIVKRPAIAIISFILYFPVESIIGNLISKEFYQFFPLKVYADLTPMPFFRQVLATDKTSGTWIMDMDYKVLLAGVYVVLFFLLTYFILKRRDL